MPFTLSHAVLAPPLAKISRHTLPVGALAIGCMTPDLIRLFTDQSVFISHEWSGLLIPDLLVGILFCLLWYLLYRPALYDWLSLQDELSLNSLNRLCGFGIACIIGILLGCVTHIVWDGLTHDDFRTFAFQHFLGRDILLFGTHYPVHRLLQLGTSVITLPILGWMCLDYFRKHHVAQPRAQWVHIFFGLLILISLAAGGYFLLNYNQQLDPVQWKTDTYAVTGKAINYFSRGFLASLSIGCFLFILLKRISLLTPRT